MNEKMMVYSRKLDKKVAVKNMKCDSANLGWCLSGWSKSGGWKSPVEK